MEDTGHGYPGHIKGNFQEEEMRIFAGNNILNVHLYFGILMFHLHAMYFKLLRT